MSPNAPKSNVGLGIEANFCSKFFATFGACFKIVLPLFIRYKLSFIKQIESTYFDSLPITPTAAKPRPTITGVVYFKSIKFF